jgi:hypothetical protein
MSTPFITTYSGKKVNPLDLKVEDIDIRDIAHHLACINRFVGALTTPVSVAQHSLCVSRLLAGTGYELAGLLHDATEAYLGDVSKWVKHDDRMSAYQDAEMAAWVVICEKFSLNALDIDMQTAVDAADTLMVRIEAHAGLSNNGQHLFEAHPITHPCPTSDEQSRALRLIGHDLLYNELAWRDVRHLFMKEFRNLLKT